MRPNDRAGVRRRPATLGLLATQIRYQLTLLRRSPMAGFVTLVIPVMVLLAAGLLYHGVHLSDRGGISYAQFVTPAMLAFAVITACYMSVVASTVLAREDGILKRIHATPLPPSVYFAARIVSAAVAAVAGVVIVAAVGAGVYGFQIVWAALPVVTLTVLLAIVSFCALAFAVSAFIPTADSALPIAWGSMLPLCFISDVFEPIDAAPGWLKTVASCFPLRPFANSLEWAFNPAVGTTAVPWGRLGVIAAWGAGAAVVALLRFRWQPTGSQSGRVAAWLVNAKFVVSRSARRHSALAASATAEEARFMSSATPTHRFNTPTHRFKVLIAGSGVAALEAVMALRDLAGERVQITLLTPDSQFVYRPMTVREPFSGPLARHYPLRRLIDDFELDHHVGSLASVDPGARTVTTTGEAKTLEYDALLLAIGAQQGRRLPHALNLDDRSLDEQLHGLIQDVEEGMSKRLAFVVPPGPCWPLPIYELALMTARRAYDMGLATLVTIVTPERAPLAIFGEAASDAVAQELRAYRVATILGADCTVTDAGQLLVQQGRRELPVDRIIAMPELHGPTIPGIASVGERHFISVNNHCAVARVERIFAAGDITDFPVKQGGIAAQQADTAAEAIAALAGIAIDPVPLHPTLKGILLGGRLPLHLRARLVDGHAVDSEASTEPLWTPPDKISSRHLTAYLDALDQRSLTA